MADADPSPADPTAIQNTGWMSDVQRALAIMLVGGISLAMVAVTIRIVISGDADAINDMAKTLQSNLTNMALIALGFFFGNTMAKMAQDAGQQKVVDKLTSSAGPPTGGPVAPVPATVVVIAWWSKLTPEEQTAVGDAAHSDPKAAVFMAAAQTGSATPDDLAYLVSKGLLTQARSDAIQASP